VLFPGVQDEMERTMISKLKTECGYQFTSKLEGMFTDMRISKGVNDDYQLAVSRQQAPRAMDFEVNVLTAGFWPSASSSSVRVPDVIVRTCIAPFTDHYLASNSGRKLSWQYHLGK
jgi:cullin 3